ncbi:MAG: endonuclease MutS2 [Syntrophomonadaceae bacterium]|jgi:DNA mismatch repair protein MutS2
MDKQTLLKLEFDKIQQQLAALTYFEGGRQKALAIQPLNDRTMVLKMLDETEEAMELLRFSEPAFLSSVKPVKNHLSKAKVKGMLSPGELSDIYHLLRASRLIVKYTSGNTCRELKKISSGITEFKDLENKIFQAIDEEGLIRDDASPQLRTIRGQIARNRTKIKEFLQKFIRSESNQKILQDTLITERDGRYVVPVKQEHRGEVKGIVHDESASGATIFIEPLPVVEHNNRIRSLQAEEKREIERILRELSSGVAVCTGELTANMEILAYLDLVFARARLAYKMDAYRPEINDHGIIEIEKARHPLLGTNAVPVNIQLGQKFDMLVITGPNTGGKTVVLKTLGLLTIMAMSGLFIPAQERSRISLFESIYVDIGDEQSIEQSLSTFSSHIKNIIGILSKVDRQSLVLLDELGAGTDPSEGAALAAAILEELKKIRAKVVVTTHQSELKTFAYKNDRVENACVEFDPVTLMPSYELTIGMPGQSNAFQIASRLGLNNKLVQRAKELVPEQEAEIGNMIRQMKESRYRYDASSREIEELKKELLAEREALKQEKRAFVEERTMIAAKARQEADQYVRSIKREADEAIKELKQILKDKDKPPKWHEVETSRQKLKKLGSNNQIMPPAAVVPEDLQPGDYVKLVHLGQKGYVLEKPNPQGNLTVQAGILKLNVKKEQVIKIEDPEEKKMAKSRNSFLEKARTISPEIDIRGNLAEEALQIVEKYIDDAYLVGLPSVRVIHGKGTGALRTAVRNYLQGHKCVKAFRDGLREEGGFGVTVIELK